ncbi:MAG: tRNA pseudouridine(55) synthase TruB [Clostridiales bacterium]|jgi:tRNA pseudouridine55 synthase|nr:tRNA pseudouridine(55) synthase TruB [Clostridiales bacterium]
MEGILNILKPPGMTSSNVVADVKKLTGIKRVGHMGTLDPGAAGVLPICLGRATRLFDIFQEKEKAYTAEIAFGIATDTQDSYGAVVARDDKTIGEDAFAAALQGFSGDYAQVAPAYSALKEGGRPLYAIAREGGSVPSRTRTVRIYGATYIAQTGPNRFLFSVTCSRGTYVRTLCADIGERLGTYAHLSFLLRTAAGPFRIEDTHTLAELTEKKDAGHLAQAVISVESALGFLPAFTVVNDRLAARLKNGCAIPLPEGAIKEGLCRVYTDAFLGVAQAAAGACKMKLFFNG